MGWIVKTLLTVFLLIVSASSFAKEYTFVAAPKGSIQEEKAIYEPIAEYLSRETGEKFIYVYIRDWITYRKAIYNDTYDVYFDGSHLSSYLVGYRNHEYLVRLKEWLSFVVIRRTENKLGPIQNLAGKTVCLHPEPNQATLMFLSRFDNPSRQPSIKVISGWRAAYDGVINGACVAAVVPYELFETYNVGKKTVMMEQFDLVPNQTFTASARIPDNTMKKIRNALLNNDNPIMKRLLNVYSSKGMIPVESADYKDNYLILTSDTVLGLDITRKHPMITEKKPTNAGAPVSCAAAALGPGCR